MDVTIGELLDKKYRIVRLLGEGGMGAVYEGENIRIHHRVAIKVLHASIATNGAAVERFEREAQAAGRIGSEHIVEVYDLGDLPTGARYMVMEFLDGEPLSERIRQVGRMAAEQVAPIMIQLLDGLGAAHTAGIVHRDIKPENIFLVKPKNGGGDFVKIVDFGVSKFNTLGGDNAMNMTRTGAVIGTPYYMSPEQARGAKTIDHRSDLYSVGVVLYECATGRVPFDAETFNELMFKIALEPPPDPEAIVQGLDPRFAAIIRKAMAREIADRFQSAAEFANAIREWLVASGAMLAVSGRPSGPSIEVRGSMASMSSVSAVLVDGSKDAPRVDVLGMTTGASFSSTSADRAATKKRGPILALAGVAVALVAVLGVAATRLSGTREAQASAASPAVAAPPPPAASPAPAPTPAERAAATADVTPQPVASAAASAAATPSAEPAATATSRGHHSTRHSASAPAPKPSATGAADPTTQVKGRTIHTEL